MRRKLTEDDRHYEAQQAAVCHLSLADMDALCRDPMRTVCGLNGPGGLSWVADEGEFEDRESWRCKRCERTWLRWRDDDMQEARTQSGRVGGGRP